MENIILCQQCGAELVGRRIVKNGAKPTKYCSKACCIKASTLRRTERRPKRRIECPVCYGMFTPCQGQKYCCKACGTMAHAIREFAKVHHDPLRQSSQLELPPPLVVLARAANIRQRRDTPDAIRPKEIDSPSGHPKGRPGQSEQPADGFYRGDDYDDQADVQQPAYRDWVQVEPELAYADDAA